MNIDNSDKETPCTKREDKIHCECWWDGDKCCACGAPEMSHAKKIEYEMENE